ncbi:MAG: hypothetical protein PHG04_04510, partial [Candidatus Nanoarchaeia archaeon]|nr:hypothetical protein [Candidatus Nanoarchaeia archaeon]
MIEYFDSIDLAFKGKSFVKKDLFYALIKNKKLDLKKYFIIGVDDKLGVLKIIEHAKSRRFKAASFWINRHNFKAPEKKHYDCEIKSLKEVTDFIESKKIKNPLILLDFDNTLAKANYELTKRSMKEKNFWDKLQINFLTTAIMRILAPFTYLTIFADFFKPSNKPYPDSKDFKKYLIKNKIP